MLGMKATAATRKTPAAVHTAVRCPPVTAVNGASAGASSVTVTVRTKTS